MKKIKINKSLIVKSISNNNEKVFFNIINIIRYYEA